MNTDAELDRWREQWQSDTTVAADLRRKVERQSRLMKIGIVADLLVTVVIGGGSTVWALESGIADAWLVPAATWVFIAAAWIFRISVSRGNWSPSRLDAASFVELSIRRCRGQLKAIRFGAVLFLIEIAFSLTWVYKHLEPKKPVLEWLWFGSVAVDVVWIATIAFAAFLLWYRRKKKAEFKWLLELKQQMTSPVMAQNNR